MRGFDGERRGQIVAHGLDVRGDARGLADDGRVDVADGEAGLCELRGDLAQQVEAVGVAPADV